MTKRDLEELAYEWALPNYTFIDIAVQTQGKYIVIALCNCPPAE